MTATASRTERLGILLLLVAAGWVLYVPRERVPLLYDVLAYASQAVSLVEGRGNTIPMNGEDLPGFYPAGVPLLLALPMLGGDHDLRAGQPLITLAALLTLLLVQRTGSRLAGPAAGFGAALALLSSPAFRETSGLLMSQVPTALVVALVAWLLLTRGSTGSTVLAGLLAMLAVLLRYANAGFPLAVGACGVLLGAQGTPGFSGRRALALLTGLAAGGALVLAHGEWGYGSPLATGYSAWGWDVSANMSWRHLVALPEHFGIEDDWPLVRAAVGAGALYGPVVAAAAAVGLVGCWRSNRPVAVLVLLGLVGDFALLAPYSFHSPLYLVGTLPLVALAAGLGATALAERLGARAWAPVALLAVAALGVLREPPPDDAVEAALARHAAVTEMARRLPADAALVTTAEPGLVEPLFVGRGGRRALYLPPFVGPLPERVALAELGAVAFDAPAVAAWARARRAEGRVVFLDQNPPPRAVTDEQRALHRGLRQLCELAPSVVENVVELAPRGEAVSSDPSGR